MHRATDQFRQETLFERHTHMTLETLKIQLDDMSESGKDKIHFASDEFKRIEQHFNDFCSQVVDIHSKQGVRVHYLSVHSENASSNIKIFIPGDVIRVLKGSEYDTVLRVSHKNRRYTIWLPSAVRLIRFDESQRFAQLDSPPLSYQWELNPDIQMNLLLSGNLGETSVIPIVVLEDPEAQFVEEIIALSDTERRLYRKSDWFFAERPSDIWNYLINGSIYDPRHHKGINKRFKCQQCAFAWWSYFNFLHKKTDKRLYDIIQDEIAYSVLLDMSKKGEWGHGYWSNNIETHTRFHLDGIHLLISQHEKTGEKLWLDASERGMSFIINNLTERLDEGGTWFLHDTIEHTAKHHFASTLFGKTPGNSLCINTHVQALTVLHRLHLLIADNQLYNEIFTNGVKALQIILDHQPGKAFYKLLMPFMIKYKKRRRAHTLKGKLNNILQGIIIPRIYWFMRHQFPRLVYPGGFTERDLTLSFFSDRYHIINLKDFLTLYQQVSLPWLRLYIKDGVAFIRKLIAELDLRNALASSSYYIELIDVLYMYDRLIEPVESESMKKVENAIYLETGGYSLDYYTSEFVRADENA